MERFTVQIPGKPARLPGRTAKPGSAQTRLEMRRPRHAGDFDVKKSVNPPACGVKQNLKYKTGEKQAPAPKLRPAKPAMTAPAPVRHRPGSPIRIFRLPRRALFNPAKRQPEPLRKECGFHSKAPPRLSNHPPPSFSFPRKKTNPGQPARSQNPAPPRKKRPRAPGKRGLPPPAKTQKKRGQNPRAAENFTASAKLVRGEQKRQRPRARLVFNIGHLLKLKAGQGAV